MIIGSNIDKAFDILNTKKAGKEVLKMERINRDKTQKKKLFDINDNITEKRSSENFGPYGGRG